MDRVVMRKGGGFSVNSPYLYDKVRRVTKQKVLLTPNAIPAEWFLEYDKKRSSSFEIVSINNGFRGRKNVARLIEAFALVRKEFSDARLTLIGHGHEPGGEAYLWAQERDLLQNISFKGLLSNSEIMDILDVSDLLAHPALEESFGMTLVEAMARKVPVLGGQSSGAVPWVLDQGRAGKIVDVTDSISIAAGILAIGRNEALWARYSTSGYQHAKDVFHATTVSEQLIVLYNHISQN
jgi:glycosyltransferase involved in cell wall biosynthesis